MTIAHTDLIAQGYKKPGDAICFTVYGQPVAKARARAFLRNGHISHYTPDKTVCYENLVALAASEAMQKIPPLQSPIKLTLSAFLAIPKSWRAKKQVAAATGQLPHITRPDLDNIVKAVKDGLNGVAWQDDAQVVVCNAKKHYGVQPRVDIVILPIDKTTQEKG